VDLGSVRQVDRVRLNWETAYAAEYTISTSTDGTTFSNAATVSLTQAGVETTTFSARGARYVRVTGVRRGTAWGYSLWDANVYGPDDTANRSPTARATATPTSGEAPLAVSFDGTGSSDPDGDALTYAWDLDGDGAHDDASTAKPSWTYTATGSHTAGLRVSDGRGAPTRRRSRSASGCPSRSSARRARRCSGRWATP
jgi:PKD repeat protein